MNQILGSNCCKAFGDNWPRYTGTVLYNAPAEWQAQAVPIQAVGDDITHMFGLFLSLFLIYISFIQGDKIRWSENVHKGVSYTGKTSLYWIRTQLPSVLFDMTNRFTLWCNFLCDLNLLWRCAFDQWIMIFICFVWWIDTSRLEPFFVYRKQ